MVERVVWDHEAAGSKPVTRTKNPLGSMISEDFLLFLCLLRRKSYSMDVKNISPLSILPRILFQGKEKLGL